MKPYLPVYLKDQNRKIIFDLIRDRKQISRTEISRATGISLPTVMKAVDKMLSVGIVTETDEIGQQEGAGRKSRLLRFNADAYLSIGIEFEGSVVNVGLVDMNGKCLERRKAHIYIHQRNTDLSELTQLVDELTEIANAKHSAVIGIAIGFPAAINPKNNSIVRWPSLGILEETPFEELFPSFCQSLKIPYYLENDVNLACEGEAFLRRESDCENLLYVSLGTGFGAGIILNGQLWRGMNYKSGEIGDTLISPSFFIEPQPSFAEFENTINLDAIAAKFNIDLQNETKLSKELTEAICDYIVPYISLTLFNLANLLDINLCVVTGIIPQLLGETLLDRIRYLIDKTMLNSNCITVTPALPDCGFAGATVTVLEHTLRDLLDN